MVRGPRPTGVHGDAEHALASRRVIGHLIGRNPDLISRYCDPAACDVRTRALLYDTDAVADLFAGRQTRTKKRACATRQVSPIVEATGNPCPKTGEQDLPEGFDRFWFLMEDQSWRELKPVQLIKLAEWSRRLQALNVEITPDRWAKLLREARAIKTSPVPAKRKPVDEVVYYIRVGHLIKIGYTGNLKNRMGYYPPHAIILATEPGGRDLEQQRLRQFGGRMSDRSEWFYVTPELIAHINSLRERPLTPRELQ